MNRQEHLFTILAEEAAEIAQDVSKLLRFGVLEGRDIGSLTNARRLEIEVNQLYAMVDMINQDPKIPFKFDVDEQVIIDKKANVEKYLLYSAECGTLQDS